eukprot:TRINITY_DN1376_c0_g2_i1.p1 TRINITY_DN1376_c0_g2~~TRINITY_DN1376_c0_g2_i1.p1  ORF type:complete len:349 (+),score=63.34 TRINITY_DN1376_c0_g2_i1:284-1330(+)
MTSKRINPTSVLPDFMMNPFRSENISFLRTENVLSSVFHFQISSRIGRGHSQSYLFSYIILYTPSSLFIETTHRSAMYATYSYPVSHPFPSQAYFASYQDEEKKVVSNINRGYQVCNAKNRAGKPCQRIGVCPFHFTKTPLEIVSAACKASEVKFDPDQPSTQKRKRKSNAREEPPAHRGYLSWGPSQVNQYLHLQGEESPERVQPSYDSLTFVSSQHSYHSDYVPTFAPQQHQHNVNASALVSHGVVAEVPAKTHQRLIPKREITQLSSPDLFEVLDISESAAKENIVDSSLFPTFSSCALPIMDEWLLDESLSSPLSFSSSENSFSGEEDGGKFDIDVNGTAWWTE